MKKILGVRILFLFSLIFCFKSQAQTFDLYQKVEYQIQYFEFQKAQSTLKSGNDEYLNAFYSHHILFLKYFISEKKIDKNLYFNSFDENVARFKKVSIKSYIYDALLAEIYFQHALVEFRLQKNFDAAWDIRRAYLKSKNICRKYPNANAPKKICGTVELALSSAPRKFHWVFKILGFKTDVIPAYQKLKEAAKSAEFLQFESEIILFFARQNILQEQEKATQQISKLYQQHSKSIFYAFLYGTQLLADKKTDEAIQVLKKSESFKTKAVYPIHFIDYQLAKAYSYQENYEKATIFFQKFINQYKGSSFKTDAAFRLAWSNVMLGKDDLAKSTFQLIGMLGNSTLDADKYAYNQSQKYTGEISSIEKSLMSARNLFDGGYYGKAISKLEILKQNNSLNEVEKLELNYRLGRVFHEQKNYENALQSYKNCFDYSGSEQRWMAVYAVFYTAVIYKEKNDLISAKKYYQQCLKYDDYDYQNGLEQKAKAALKKL